MRQRSSAAEPTPSFRRRLKKQERRRRRQMDWRIPFLGLASLLLLAISLFLLSQDRPQVISVDDDILHIVSTRFMQNQPNLLWLGRARLMLFEYICLPTMIQQSTQNFIWIIQTDPQIAKEIKHKLRQLIRPYPHFFLVGYNSDKSDNSDKYGNHTSLSFEDFAMQAKDLLKAPVYSGNVKILRQAYTLCCSGSNDILLLQTRLDADDGLRLNYFEQIQQEARNTFLKTPSFPNWYYWCIKHHLEWYASTNRWIPVQHEKLCITPGLTVGTPIRIEKRKSKETGPPWTLGHDKLFKEIKNHPDKYNCGAASCIRLVAEDAGAGAIRSRTWTSAGMMNIFPDNPQTSHQPALKDFVHQQFGLTEDLAVLKLYLQQHIAEIAKDNLEGQCTYGHSCKLSSVETLQRLVELQYEGREGQIPQHPIGTDELDR